MDMASWRRGSESILHTLTGKHARGQRAAPEGTEKPLTEAAGLVMMHAHWSTRRGRWRNTTLGASRTSEISSWYPRVARGLPRKLPGDSY